jgi:hypothetical protein
MECVVHTGALLDAFHLPLEKNLENKEATLVKTSARR